jgi:hypothetical protein
MNVVLLLPPYTVWLLPQQQLSGEELGVLPELPASQVVRLSSEYFSRPMLEPMVREQRTSVRCV